MKKTLAILLTLALGLGAVLPAVGEEETLQTLTQQLWGCWLLQGVIRAGEDIELPEDLWDFTGLEFRDDGTVFLPYSEDPDPRPYAVVDEYTLTIGEDYYSFLIELDEEEGDRLTLWVDYPQEPSVTLMYGRVDSFPALAEAAESVEAAEAAESPSVTLEELLGVWQFVAISDGATTLSLEDLVSLLGSLEDLVSLLGYEYDPGLLIFMEITGDGTLSLYTNQPEDERADWAFRLEGNTLIIEGSVSTELTVAIRESWLWLEGAPHVNLVLARKDEAAPETADASAARAELVGLWNVVRFEGPAMTFTAPRQFAANLGVTEGTMRSFEFTAEGSLIIRADQDGKTAELLLGYTLAGSTLTILDGEGHVLHTGEIVIGDAELSIEAVEGTTLILCRAD